MTCAFTGLLVQDGAADSLCLQFTGQVRSLTLLTMFSFRLPLLGGSSMTREPRPRPNTHTFDPKVHACFFGCLSFFLSSFSFDPFLRFLFTFFFFLLCYFIL